MTVVCANRRGIVHLFTKMPPHFWLHRLPL